MRSTMGMAMAALLAASGCDATLVGAGVTVKGSGVVKEEARDLSGFTGLDISSSFEATATIGPKAEVTLGAEDNLLPLIKTEVRDGRLVVGLASGQTIRATKPLKIKVVMPSLDFVAARGASKLAASAGEASTFRVESSGASTVEVTGLTADAIEVTAEGASRVTLEGRARRLTLDASGASKVVAVASAFESAKVDVSGASKAEVNVTGSIDGEVSGASSLDVKGKPIARGVKTSGASSLSY